MIPNICVDFWAKSARGTYSIFPTIIPLVLTVTPSALTVTLPTVTALLSAVIPSVQTTTPFVLTVSSDCNQIVPGRYSIGLDYYPGGHDRYLIGPTVIPLFLP